jgi:hypothetical protein
LAEQTPLAPVPRLDAKALLQSLNAEAGTALEFIGPAPGGAVGAAFVRWPDSREGVLTRGAADASTVHQAADLMAIARNRGIPCPRYDLIHQLPGMTAIVQERLPGSPPTEVDDRLILAMVELNDRFADLLGERPDVPVLDLYLTHSGPGFCIHESLQAYDPRTRRLLDWVHAVGALPRASMTGNDLVHADFHPGNILVDEAGAITGIVDWDGASRGDRHFGLVTLAFDLGWRFRMGGEEWHSIVSDRLDAIDQDALLAYWAHMSLRLVDWAIRHYPAEVVDHYLAFAATRADF